MSEAPKEKRVRKPRRNYERELSELKTYIQHRLEFFGELSAMAGFSGESITDGGKARIDELQAILKKMEAK